MKSKEELMEIVDELIDDLREEYLSNSHVVIESGEGGKCAMVEDTPNLEELANSYLLSDYPELSEEEKEFILDEISIPSLEESFEESIIDNYNEDYYFD